uniref:Uncharacterized protein n=1 Tax=Anguilla anguilla TaxID=7936 RepID=A0A0E9SUW0_ANGAN
MRLRNGTVATAIIFLTSFLSLSWYTAWQNGKGKRAHIRVGLSLPNRKYRLACTAAGLLLNQTARRYKKSNVLLKR